MTEEPIASAVIQPYSISAAFQKALLAIPRKGVLCKLDTGYVYLKVSDAFRGHLIPLIEGPIKQRLNLERRVDDVGAHISIIYPDEIQTAFEVPDLGRSVDFEIEGLGLYTASLHGKSYLVLLVTSVELEQIRVALHLPKEHFYYGVRVPFHITLAGVALVSN